MDYKEKLRLAKEALESGSYDKDTIEYIFPELKESEDERIRKELIEYIKDQQSSFISAPDCRDKYEEKENNKYNSWITWLEKQGEQKPTDKPKFMVGDWVMLNENHNSIYQVENIENHHYVLRHILGGGFSTPFGLEGPMKLWTIQDAKEGDVLVLNGEVFIYAHRKQLYSIAVAHCFIDSVGVFHFDGEFGYTEKGNSIHPATTSQRDLLLAKMKEAGYEWDEDKKELKKL